MAQPRLAGLVFLIAAAAPATTFAQPVSLGFNCRVAEGPRLTACRPLATTLSDAHVEALRHRIETTPACQLKGLKPGQAVQRAVSFPDLSRLLSPDAADEPHVIAGDWVRPADPAALVDYYPERASREGVEGWATIDCRVAEEGVARDCKVVSEDPPDYGFGEASTRAAETFRLSPTMRGCEVVDDHVRIPLRWVLPHDDEAPVEPAPRREPIRISLPLPSFGGVLAFGGVLLGLALAVLGLLGWRRGQTVAGRVPQIVEKPSRRPPVWLLTPVGLALSAWAASRFWTLPRPPARDLSLAAPDLDMNGLGALTFVATLGAVVLVLMSLRAQQDRKVPDWATGDFRAGLLVVALWIWTRGHRAYDDPLLGVFVVAARIAMAALVLTVLATLTM